MKAVVDFTQFRESNSADLGNLVNFLLQSYRASLKSGVSLMNVDRELEIARLTDKTQPIRVAEIGSRIVGTYSLCPDGEVKHLAIESSVHGQRLAQMILSDMISTARRRGLIKIWLCVPQMFEKGHSVLQTLGFQQVSENEISATSILPCLKFQLSIS